MKNAFYLLPLFFLSSCIQDDILFDTVEETLRITNPIDSLGIGDSIQFQIRYTNNIGEIEMPNVSWLSSAASILQIDDQGLAIGQLEGRAEVYATVDIDGIKSVHDTLSIVVIAQADTMGNEAQTRSGSIRTTSSYQLEGDFVVTEEQNNLFITFADNYEASRNLPGLYLYLTNNPNSVANALEIGKVETFSGAHTYELPGVNLNDYDYLLYYCKPFRVKVGDGQIQ